jgi:hypothetical protein
MPASSSKQFPRRINFNAKTPLLDARRLAELVGFLLSVAGLLTALSLTSFCRATHCSLIGWRRNIHNWIGLVALRADCSFRVWLGRTPSPFHGRSVF